MKDYNYYLDKAKTQNGLQSDLAINRALGFKGSMASMLRNGKTHLSDEKMIELAKLAGENPLTALLNLNIMRTHGSAKKAYEKLYEGLSRTVQTLCVVSLLLLSSTPAKSADFLTGKKLTQPIAEDILSLKYCCNKIELSQFLQSRNVTIGKAFHPAIYEGLRDGKPYLSLAVH